MLALTSALSSKAKKLPSKMTSYLTVANGAVFCFKSSSLNAQKSLVELVLALREGRRYLASQVFLRACVLFQGGE